MEHVGAKTMKEDFMALEREILKVMHLPLTSLKVSSVQPRENFDESLLLELSQSIKEYGVLQPVIVRKNAQGNREIIAGERRYRAAKMANLLAIPCIEMDISREDAWAIALVENLQREDLNPIEEAKAYQRLISTLNWSQENVAQRVGKERTTITNALRLLKLPCDLQDMLIKNEISMGHARAILGLSDQELMAFVAQKVMREGLSVRRTESLIRSLNLGSKLGKKDERQKESLLMELEKKLSEKFGTKVLLKLQGKAILLEAMYPSSSELGNLLTALDVEI